MGKICQHLFALQNLTRKLHLFTQVFGSGRRIFSSLAPIFGGRTDIMCTRHAQSHLLALQLNKIDASPIFVVPKNYAKFGIESGTPKIGAASIFLSCNTRICVCACLVCIKSGRLCNLGTKFPIFSIFQPKPC